MAHATHAAEQSAQITSTTKRVRVGKHWVTITHFYGPDDSSSPSQKTIPENLPEPFEDAAPSSKRPHESATKRKSDARTKEAAKAPDSPKSPAPAHRKERSQRQYVDLHYAPAPPHRKERQKSPKKATSTKKASSNAPKRANGRQTAHQDPSSRKIVDAKPLPVSGALQMLVRTAGDQTQVVMLEGGSLVEHYVDMPGQHSLIGNVYIGVVKTVVPALEAAFVDIGIGEQGILRRRNEGVSSLKSGDRLLVRVVKDAHGSKGPKLKADMAITGRYLVLLPGAPHKIGVSRHLTKAQRTRLHTQLRKLDRDGAGLIARSAAADASDDALERDLIRLMREWEHLSETDISHGPAPRMLHEELSLPLFVTREHFSPQFKKMLVDDQKTYNEIRAYLEEVEPALVPKVQLYTSNDMDLFDRYLVGDQLRKALERNVYLPSGGHIVIDRTEALTAVDVNTGKFTGKGSRQEVIFRTNMEAAVEIARQIRLRDIGGIIVIDFIDMDSATQQEKVSYTLAASMAKDRTTSDIYNAMDELGLVHLSRKRRSPSILETFSRVCTHCDGRGVVLDADAAVFGPGTPRVDIDEDVEEFDETDIAPAITDDDRENMAASETLDPVPGAASAAHHEPASVPPLADEPSARDVPAGLPAESNGENLVDPDTVPIPVAPPGNGATPRPPKKKSRRKRRRR